jgi:tripartite-type tricarboxylate transporter receptor subunit TctC
MFKRDAGIYAVHIPYNGGNPAQLALLSGQVDFNFDNLATAAPNIKAGKLKALGVTSAKRLAAFPDVPAIGESLPGYESSAWFGLFGPGRMSPDVAKKLADAARAAVQSPEVKRRIENEGATPVGNSPEEFARFVDSEIVRWRKVVQYAGAKPE